MKSIRVVKTLDENNTEFSDQSPYQVFLGDDSMGEIFAYEDDNDGKRASLPHYVERHESVEKDIPLYIDTDDEIEIVDFRNNS
jgi:hypothetical protein